MDTGSSTSSSNNDSNGVRVNTEERKIRLENPFTLKVGQVFTGFGIGCGIGIGVGRPLNLGAIPMVNQVMTATRGATDAFSGVGRHVNNSLKKVGAKGIEAGIGCGVGFGHGFGVGLAVKRGVVDRIQLYLIQAMTKLMMKSGMPTGLSIGQDILPASLQAGMKTEASIQNPVGIPNPLEVKVPHSSSRGLLTDRNTNFLSSHENDSSTANISSSNASYSSRTEKVISNFLQSPLVKDEDTTTNKLFEHLRSENNLLHIVMKHQQVIDELMQENEKLRRILVEDLKVSPSKLQTSYSSGRPLKHLMEKVSIHQKVPEPVRPSPMGAGGEAGLLGAGDELTDGPGLIVGANATGAGGDISGGLMIAGSGRQYWKVVLWVLEQQRGIEM